MWQSKQMTEKYIHQCFHLHAGIRLSISLPVWEIRHLIKYTTIHESFEKRNRFFSYSYQEISDTNLCFQDEELLTKSFETCLIQMGLSLQPTGKKNDDGVL